MRTIIISDLHNRVDWIEPFLSSIEYDKVVFLGDYLDDYNDTIAIIENTARWLKQSIEHKNRIHLFGTHDIWYRFPDNPFLQPAGSTAIKSYAINEILTLKDWDKLKLYHHEQSFLMTHAGLHPSLLGESKNMLATIDNKTERALKDADKGKSHPWLDCGYARGGYSKIGGLTWLDWQEEFEPVHDLNQIVGHTCDKEPRKWIEKDSENYCIDTENKHYIVIENGKVTIEKIKKEKNNMMIEKQVGHETNDKKIDQSNPQTEDIR